MKVFSSILALYMMVLFIMPCADVHQEDDLQHFGHTTEITHQDSHDHSEKADLCTPFCVCNCCGKAIGLVFLWNAINFSEIRSEELSKPSPQYISQFTPSYFGEIWQPPQINV